MRPFVSARVICRSRITVCPWASRIGSWSVTPRPLIGLSVQKRRTHGSRQPSSCWQALTCASASRKRQTPRSGMHSKPNPTGRPSSWNHPIRYGLPVWWPLSMICAKPACRINSEWRPGRLCRGPPLLFSAHSFSYCSAVTCPELAVNRSDRLSDKVTRLTIEDIKPVPLLVHRSTLDPACYPWLTIFLEDFSSTPRIVFRQPFANSGLSTVAVTTGCMRGGAHVWTAAEQISAPGRGGRGVTLWGRRRRASDCPDKFRGRAPAQRRCAIDVYRGARSADRASHPQSAARTA